MSRRAANPTGIMLRELNTGWMLNSRSRRLQELATELNQENAESANLPDPVCSLHSDFI
jgi:hypothetical protein